MADRITLEQLHAAVASLNTEATRRLLCIDESLIERPETTRAYIERHHQWARLLEVVRSIPQLVGQDNTIPLVGFLGHFSSGKSSLINALLKIDRNDQPHYRRATGEHPTDKGITLTTHFDHVDAVRRQFPPSLEQIAVMQGPRLPMLNHMTLVDTPGLGDNTAEMELVIRFLHLVHVLVLPIHGRQPFADSDKAFALLKLAFKDLAGVPKIFVVTNADHFLTDRRGEFAIDWNQSAADQFWQETLTRLVSDPRLRAHHEALTATEAIFVDSVDGFQIDRLRETLLPIVQDDAQRGRTDAARAGYVFRCTAVALRHLETYVSERSRNLAELRLHAEERSRSTETAIEVLVSDLGARLAMKAQSLPVDPQQLATLNDPLAQIITVQTIQSSVDVNKYQVQFQEELKARARLKRRQVVRLAVATYERRRQNPQAKYQSEILAREEVDQVVSESALHVAMKKYAQAAGQSALLQYKERLRAGLAMLDSPSESFRVDDILRDFRVDLERFERKHDDSVKGLFAYVTQPTSIGLLLEHGFVMFDDAGRRRGDPENIDVFGLQEFKNIENAVSRCKNTLRDARLLVGGATQLPERDDTAIGAGAAIDELRGKFGSSAMKPVVEHVARQVATAVAKFEDEVQATIDTLLAATREREREQKARIQSVWAARRQIGGRFLIVACVVGGSVYAVTQYLPERLTMLWSSVSESVLREIVVKSGPVLVVALLSALFTFLSVGVSNPEAKAAFSSIMRLRLSTRWHRHKQRRQLRNSAKKLLDTVPSGLNQLDVACLTAIRQWIQTENAEFIEVHGHLARARERVNQRGQDISGVASAIAPWVANLPKRLLERSQVIREEAIAEHMKTIREAADSVEILRSEIVRIASNAEVSAS